MNEYRKHPNPECQPPEHPAHQPVPPKEDEKCETLPETKPPDLKGPEKCPPPDPCCKCPTKPDSTPDCLDDLIAKQNVDIDATDKATKFREELKALQDKAKEARQAYTRDKYKSLVEEWVRQDKAIAELIRKLKCAVPCWKCILDCYVCPLFNQLHYAQKWLYDDGTLYTNVHDLYDLEYWHKRDKAAKERTFDRIKKILAAWEKPVATIEKILAENKSMHDAASAVIGTEPGKAIFDVFLRLVPMHLAIAPAAGPDTTTRIDKKYLDFCKCDDRKPEYCCGINVGELSFRDRLIGPQPYLIDPTLYFDLICCLVKNRYVPSQAAFSKAESDLIEVQGKIAGFEKQLAPDWPKNLEKDAKGAIPSVIDCCEYDKDEEEPRSSQSS